MPYYKFGPNDIFQNIVETHPKCKFLINDKKIYYNEQIPDASKYVNNPNDANVDHVKTGSISLYEMNINREETYNHDQVSRSIRFNKDKESEVSQYITIKDTAANANSSAWRFSSGGMTIGVWVKIAPDAYTATAGERNRGYILQWTESHSGGASRNSYIEAFFSHQLGIKIGDMSMFAVAQVGFDDGKWHHLVITVQNFALKVYLDGNFKGEYKPPHGGLGDRSWKYGSSFNIGGMNPNVSGNGELDGSIDDIALWKAALSHDAIRDIYNHGIPTDLKTTFRSYVSAAHLAGWWRMGDTVAKPDFWLEFTGPDESQEIKDSSSNNIVCTVNGTAEISTDHFKHGTSSLSLDGSSDDEDNYITITNAASSPILNWEGAFIIDFWMRLHDSEVSHTILSPKTDYTTTSGNVAPISLAWRGQTYNGVTTASTGYRNTFWLKIGSEPEDNYYFKYFNDQVHGPNHANYGGFLTTEWYHIEVTRDTENNIKMFRDGEQLTLAQASGYSTSPPISEVSDVTRVFDPGTGGYLIGRVSEVDSSSTPQDNHDSFYGYIDEFKISKTDHDVQSLFPRILDESGNKNHGTAHNMLPSDVSDYSEPSMIYPYIAKGGASMTFKTVSTTEYQSFQYGDTIQGSYPMSSGLSIERFEERSPAPEDSHDLSEYKKSIMDDRPHLAALKNTLRHYSVLSPYFAVVDPYIVDPNAASTNSNKPVITNPNFGDGTNNKIKMVKWDYDKLTLISIPSIFYGSSIEKGTVNLKYSEGGTVVGELKDSKRNGELIDASDSGSVTHGLILYNEGFIVLFDDALWAQWGLSSDEPLLSWSTQTHLGFEHSPLIWVTAYNSNGTTSAVYTGTSYTFNEITSALSQPWSRAHNISHLDDSEGTDASGLNGSYRFSRHVNAKNIRFSADLKSTSDGYMGLIIRGDRGSVQNTADYSKSHYRVVFGAEHTHEGEDVPRSTRLYKVIDNVSTEIGAGVTGAPAGYAAAEVGSYTRFSVAFEFIDNHYKIYQAEYGRPLVLVYSGTDDSITSAGGVGVYSSGNAGSYFDNLVVTEPDTSASSLSFNGTNRIPTLTMLAHAKKGELNHSNNPTYLTYGQDGASIEDGSGGTIYAEETNLEIVNTTKSPHENTEAGFQKQTWISKIGIYDEDNNLIAIAKLANPVRKTEQRDFTFKLKLDF